MAVLRPDGRGDGQPRLTPFRRFALYFSRWAFSLSGFRFRQPAVRATWAAGSFSRFRRQRARAFSGSARDLSVGGSNRRTRRSRLAMQLRPAEALDEELPQPPLGVGPVARRVEGADQVVGPDPAVERGHQPREADLAQGGVDLFVRHGRIVAAGRPRSRSPPRPALGRPPLCARRASLEP